MHTTATTVSPLVLFCVRGRGLERNNPELLLRTIQLYHAIANLPAPDGAADSSEAPAQPTATKAAVDAPATLSPLAARVLAEESESLLGDGGVSGAVSALVALAEDPERGSLCARVCAAQAVALVPGGDGSSTGEARGKALALVRGGLDGRGVTVKGCVAALEVVKAIVRVGGSAGENGGGAHGDAHVEEFRRACAEVFPEAEAFGE